MGQLQHDPQSHFAAARAGDTRFIGWDDSRSLLADIRDMHLMLLAGLGGQQLNPAELFTRPERVDPEPAQTVADFDVGAFMRQL